MDPALLGVLLSVAFGLFAGAVAWLRSDIKELRAENRADHRETNARIDRLEGKVDLLILALARAGFLVDPQSPQPPDPSS